MRHEVTPSNATLGYAAMTNHPTVLDVLGTRLGLCETAQGRPHYLWSRQIPHRWEFVHGRDPCSTWCRTVSCHGQAANPSRLQLLSRLTAQLLTLRIGEHPFHPLRIHHHKNILAPVHAADVMRPMVQRHVAVFVHMPRHSITGQMVQRASVVPMTRLPRPAVMSPRVFQARKRRGSTLPDNARIGLTLDRVHLLQTLLQFGHRRATLRFGPAPARPLRALDDAVLLRRMRIIPVHIDLQAHEPKCQIRRQIRGRTPRAAIVHAHRQRPTPARESAAQLDLDVCDRNLQPVPVGGKQPSRGRRRCTHRRRAANSHVAPTTSGLAPWRPLAKLHAAAGHGSRCWRAGGLWARAPDPLGGTSVARSAPWAAWPREIAGPKERESDRLPNWDVLVAWPRHGRAVVEREQSEFDSRHGTPEQVQVGFAESNCAAVDGRCADASQGLERCRRPICRFANGATSLGEEVKKWVLAWETSRWGKKSTNIYQHTATAR